MKKLQASMRDSSAARRKNFYRHMYRVGSYMKGCHNCGEYHWEETQRGNLVKRYDSGYDVYRSYEPGFVGWTWWCYECGAKDLRAWEVDKEGMVELELGKPPVCGTRDAKYNAKKLLRKELKMQARGLSQAEVVVKRDPVLPSVDRANKIKDLEDQINKLMALLTKK